MPQYRNKYERPANQSSQNLSLSCCAGSVKDGSSPLILQRMNLSESPQLKDGMLLCAGITPLAEKSLIRAEDLREPPLIISPQTIQDKIIQN